MRRSRWLLMTVLALSACVLGCDARKSANPLSPSIAGPIPGVQITPPKLLEPGQGWELRSEDQPLKLIIENASSNGERPLTYVIEVATDNTFVSKVFEREGVAPGTGGRTTLTLPDALASDRAYYWRARAEDGANTGPFATASFSVYTPVFIDAAMPLSPVGGVRLGSRRATFPVRNPPRSGPTGQLFHQVEISTSPSILHTVAIVTVPEQPNQTTFQLAQELDYERAYFWRVRAHDQQTAGPWSAIQTFVGPVEPPPPPPPPPPPAPSPSPGGGPAPGGPCNGSSPLSIVECERNKYGRFMSPTDMVNFLIASARSLNRNGIGGGPFGILRKAGGNQCNGYSCDIICAGNGNAQAQWDVLGDVGGANSPGWGGPHRVQDGIRVDVCEIQ